MRVYSVAPIKLNLIDTAPAVIKAPFVKASDGLKEYHSLFFSLADEKRTINCYELQELLHSCLPNDYMKSSASLDVCRRVVQAFQPSSNFGRLEYDHFRDFICSLKAWQEIFSFYSKTTSGVMKAEKLRESLRDVGFGLNSDTVQLLMLKYMRRDGTMRFGDFVACILHLIAAFNTFTRKDAQKAGVIKLNSAEWMKAVLRC